MRSLLVCLAATAVLAGCGSREVNTVEGARLIEQEVTEQLQLELSSVSCPNDVEAKAGATFECTVTGEDGSSGVATVTQKDDEGNVNFEAPFLAIHQHEEDIAADIADQTDETVELDCPEIVTVREQAKFECEATSADGTTATVSVTQTDDKGSVDYEVLES